MERILQKERDQGPNDTKSQGISGERRVTLGEGGANRKQGTSNRGGDVENRGEFMFCTVKG